MTEAQVSKNDFFHQFIVKLCSSLDIKKAVYQCSLFIKETVPFDGIKLSLITDEPHKLKNLVGVSADGNLVENVTLNIPDDVWPLMQKHFKKNDIRLMYAPENRQYAEAIAKIEAGVLESFDVAMPLVFKDKPIGFFTLRLPKELTQEQLDLLEAIQQPIAHAVASAIQYEDEEKQLTQPFSVELIFNRIKALKSIDTDKILAKKLNTMPSVIANSKVRNSVPYDRIITYCQKESIPLDLIFMHNPFILTKKDKGGLYKAILPSGVKRVNASEVETLLKLPNNSLDTYIEKCALHSPIIPPVEQLSLEVLKSFHNALLSQQIYGGSTSGICSNLSIPVASGYVQENGQVEKTGHFLHFCKEWTEKLDLSNNIFAYNVMDDSMAPTLTRGDVAIVDPNEKIPRQNGLYAVSLGGNVFIKRLMPTGKEMLTMICDNKIYPSDTLHPDNVIGEVVWYARNLRPFKIGFK